MKFLLTLTLWTLVLTSLMSQQADGKATGKGKHKHKPKHTQKHPNPFHVLEAHEVMEQIMQRNWHYAPATPIKIGKFHFNQEKDVLMLTARYSMHCRGGEKRCKNCKVEIAIYPKREYVVRDFKCNV